MNCDVLIIGGGVIGLSIARELKKRGISRITIVDKGRCSEEASWAAAGMLSPQVDADHGGAFFNLSCTSRDLYPQLAAELLAETGIDVELDRSGTLYLATCDEDAVRLRERFEWQTKAGFAVEHLSAEEVRQLEPEISPETRVALLFPNDWQVENRKLLAALRRYAEINDVRIVENCAVENLIVENGKVNGVETKHGSFFAEKTVLATGAWTSLIKLGLADMPINVEPVRGQMIMFQDARRPFERVIFTSDGYIVPRQDGRILVGSTTEHVGFDSSVTAAAAEKLQRMAAKIAPRFDTLPIVDQWSGLRPFAGDGLPVIGSIGGVKDLVVATAHYRNGILLAPLTAKIVAQKTGDDHDSQMAEEFTPDRFRRTAAAK